MSDWFPVRPASCPTMQAPAIPASKATRLDALRALQLRTPRHGSRVSP
jgi:hypothetical protein